MNRLQQLQGLTTGMYSTHRRAANTSPVDDGKRKTVLMTLVLCVGVLLSGGCQTTAHSIVSSADSNDVRTVSELEPSTVDDQTTVELASYSPEEIDARKSDNYVGPIEASRHVESIVSGIEAAAMTTVAPPTAVMQLTDVIRLAAQANPDLQAAMERTWIADATLRRARSEFYPTLSLSENYGVSNNPVNTFSFQLNQARLTFNQDFNNPATTDNFDTRLRLQHNVYTAGRRTSEREAAAWQTQAAIASVESARNQLMFRVAEAYFRLLQTNELVGVREENVEQVAEHLEIVKSRFRAETAVESDVLSVEVRLAEAQEALITTKHQVELAWAVLDNVTGVRIPRQSLPDEVPPSPWDAHLQDAEQAIAVAVSMRPELREVGSSYQAALHSMQAAESGRKPTISLVGDYDVFTGDFRSANDTFFVGLVVQLNLLDFGRTESAVAKASAQAREIAARQRRAVSDIELDVRRAWLQLSDARERFAVTEKAIEQARESLREVEVRYRGQTTTISRLIDAQVALSNARVRRANAQADIEIARASLERAIGRLSTLVV